jgi:hypothetical protein
VAVIDTIGVHPEFAHRGVGHALPVSAIWRVGTSASKPFAPRDFGLLGFLYDVGFGPSQRLPFIRRLD